MSVTCWCKQCKVIACFKCQISYHKKHDVELIEETENIADYLRIELEDIKNLKICESKDIGVRQNNLEGTLQKIETFERNLTQLKNNLKKKIEQIKRNKNMKDDWIAKILKKCWNMLK